MRKFLFFLSLITFFWLFPSPTHAVVDPLAAPNNRFGVHIISPTPDEASPAAQLVNSSGGDWGYVTVLVESKDRDTQKWQQFFNQLREKHLIPIVRLATAPQDGGFWKRPNEKEEEAWADFLDSLIWPTKNRYVTIYNEPNHATEWGNTVDAFDYAHTLDKTIDALKKKSEDFFVLNAGLDASAPQKLPAYQDAQEFLTQMNQAVPGIFNKLDGWVSHSYPNPGFVSSPSNTGRGSIRTFEWEMTQLKFIGVEKKLPIFITETGWKHAEGMKYDSSLPTAETVAKHYETAFEGAWNDPQIVAVTPFLLDYQEEPFDHFSFKRFKNEKQKTKLLAVTSALAPEPPEYYPQYETMKSLPKQSGQPIQEFKAKLVDGTFPKTVLVNQTTAFPLTFKNIGQAIWAENEPVTIRSIDLSEGLSIGNGEMVSARTEPNQTYTFYLNIKAQKLGTFKTTLQLFHGDTQFAQIPMEFSTVVKSPVLVKINAKLSWGKDMSGDYALNFKNTISDVFEKVFLNKDGTSEPVEAYTVLPDLEYKVTLSRPFYKSKTITQTLESGENVLDFGELKADYPSAVLHPGELWKLLPLSK